jgi:hypothetical protein
MMNERIVPFNYLSGRDTFDRIRRHTWNLFLTQAHKVPSSPWQGLDPKPEFATYELMNYTFTHALSGIEDLQHWRDDVRPNLPWADDHFSERVCGAPINPGVEWANWPWGSSADKFRDENGMFNHNYMERYWSRRAGIIREPSTTADEWDRLSDDYTQRSHRGIRNEYGDLNDLVGQLVKNPQSRQEWFPIFHPEDVGEVVGGRKPCSLGYQFWARGGRLHVYYPLRSCDFFHHMQDDIYLTIRLLLWVLNECRNRDNTAGYWNEIKPGTFTMHCTSLHVFANDMITMKQEGPRT